MLKEIKLRPIPDDVRGFVETLKSCNGVLGVRVFGSSAHGGWRPDSDFDLAVFCEESVEAREVDAHLRDKGVSVDQIGELKIDARVVYQKEIDLFVKEDRVTGHPGKYRMMNDIVWFGKDL